MKDIDFGEKPKIEGHLGQILQVCFSLDGKTLVSCSADKTIKIWESENLNEINTLNGHSDWVNSVSISPNN